jgi:RNA polymerase sigma-70 factor (ECF subfamily)
LTASDGDLLRRLKQGDDSARRELWDRHYEAVYRHALYKGARGNSSADAADIAQNVFVRAYKSVEGFDGRCSLKTWLLKLCQNAAIDYYRAAHHSAEEVDHDAAVAASEAGGAYSVSTSEPAEPLRHCLQMEERDQCRRWLAEVSEEQQDVVTHRLIDGLSTAETAALLGKSEGAVKMALLRGLQNLAKKAESWTRKKKEAAINDR